jgi:hypothetical protein
VHPGPAAAAQYLATRDPEMRNDNAHSTAHPGRRRHRLRRTEADLWGVIRDAVGARFPDRRDRLTGKSPRWRQYVQVVAVRHSGASLKIERKSQRILQPFRYVAGKLADLAFEAHSWQRSQSLNIGY